MNEAESHARKSLVKWGRSLFDRGLTSGSSGNLSVRLADRWLVTPTNCCLGTLRQEDLVLMGSESEVHGDGIPSKEWPLHVAMYESRPEARAVVHLHSTYAVAISCLEDLDPHQVLPPLTPYYVMRVSPLALASYHPPGDALLAQEIRSLARDAHAILLRNHGSLASGASLSEAVFVAEELEEAARLAVTLQGHRVRRLSARQVAALQHRA